MFLLPAKKGIKHPIAISQGPSNPPTGQQQFQSNVKEQPKQKQAKELKK